MITLVAGDDIHIPFSLTRNGMRFNIASSAIVKAALLSTDKQLLAGPVDCLANASGANWSKSLVSIHFPSAMTESVEAQAGAVIEVQVDDNGKSTWFAGDITIERGVIA